MNELLTKLKIYKEKNDILKENQALKFLNVSENVKEEYYNLIDQEEFYKGLFVYVNFNILTCIGSLVYVFMRDDELRESISNILSGNICYLSSENPDMYKFIFIMLFFSSLFLSKTEELARYSKYNRQLFEKQEPELIGYKYLKYIKNKN